jgi:hypothetical protein
MYACLNLHEPPLARPLIDETEVLVVASGSAGVAAGVSIKGSRGTSEVDIKNLQQELVKLGVWLF